jgi:hypothetical protein
MLWARSQHLEAQHYTGLALPTRSITQRWLARRHAAAQPFPAITLHNFVKMRGGEFFFAPSLPFLQTL